MSTTKRIKALVKAAKKGRRLLRQDRAAVYESHFNHGSGRLDTEGEQACREYDEAIWAIDAAISKATGAAA